MNELEFEQDALASSSTNPSRRKRQGTRREHEAKGFIPSTPCGPTDPWRGGIEKKMGWVIVGESLLSARVIVPGVGADFLSIGICTEPRSGCTLIPLTPQARIRSTHRTIPKKERERERRREWEWRTEREREEKIIHEMRVTAASLDQPSILGKGCRKKKKFVPGTDTRCCIVKSNTVAPRVQTKFKGRSNYHIDGKTWCTFKEREDTNLPIELVST